MHDIIRSELQKARVAELLRQAQQDRLEREAARGLPQRGLGRVLAVLRARGSALRQLAAQTGTPDAPPLSAPAEASRALGTIGSPCP